MRLQPSGLFESYQVFAPKESSLKQVQPFFLWSEHKIAPFKFLSGFYDFLKLIFKESPALVYFRRLKVGLGQAKRPVTWRCRLGVFCGGGESQPPNSASFLLSGQLILLAPAHSSHTVLLGLLPLASPHSALGPGSQKAASSAPRPAFVELGSAA